MTSPFSKDFKSGLDTQAISKEARISATNSAKRQANLLSDDPAVRARAMGTVAGMGREDGKNVATKTVKGRK